MLCSSSRVRDTWQARRRGGNQRHSTGRDGRTDQSDGRDLNVNEPHLFPLPVPDQYSVCTVVTATQPSPQKSGRVGRTDGPNMTSPFSLCLIACSPQRDSGAWRERELEREEGRVHGDALHRGPDLSVSTRRSSHCNEDEVHKYS